MAFVYPAYICLFIGGEFRRCSKDQIPSCIIDPLDDAVRQYIKYQHKFQRLIMVINLLLKVAKIAKINDLEICSAMPCLRKKLLEMKSNCFHELYQLQEMEKGNLKQIVGYPPGWNNLLEAHNQSIIIEVELEYIVETVSAKCHGNVNLKM